MKKLIMLLTLSVLLPVSAFAGGYRVALQGARMLGMAHAGVAVFGGAETVFFNPAGIGFTGSDNSFAIGVSPVISKVKYQNVQHLWTAQTHNPVVTPLYAYYSHKISDLFYLGLALYTPYGSTVKWDRDWAGSHLVNEISLRAFFFQPSFVIKPSDYFSVAVSFIVASGSIHYNKNVNRFLTDGNGNRTDITLDAEDASGAGFGISVAIRPSDKVSLGFNYRSTVWLRSRYGVATINDNPGFLPAHDHFSAALPMPAETSFGLTYRPVDKLMFTAELDETFWSVYKSLDIDFGKLPDTRMAKNWNDSFTYRLGAQYSVSTHLDVRAGYYFDQSPIPATYFAPETPSMDSHNWTLGFTYKMGKLSVDAALLYKTEKERNDSYDYYIEGMSAPRFSGSYVANAIIPSFGIQYQF